MGQALRNDDNPMTPLPMISCIIQPQLIISPDDTHSFFSCQIFVPILNTHANVCNVLHQSATYNKVLCRYSHIPYNAGLRWMISYIPGLRYVKPYTFLFGWIVTVEAECYPFFFFFV
ncbi:unnamed protein product [Gadus morhua 'NCC']